MNNSNFGLLQNKKALWYAFALTALLSAGMHWKIFSTELMGRHFWRQSKTYINTQQFYRNDWNILNPRTNNWNGETNIDRMEFPIMQWTMAVAHQIFGESITVARIYMFSLGLIAFFGFFLLIKAITNDKALAFLSAFAFYFAPVFYYYTMNPLPDIFALTCAIFALAFYYRYQKNIGQWPLLLSAIFLSLAILAKLPYVLIGVIFLYDWVLAIRDKEFVKVKQVLIHYGLSLLPPIMWYGWVIGGWGTTTVVGGILNYPTTLTQILAILKYHLLVMWPEILIGYPSLILLIVGIFQSMKGRLQNKRMVGHVSVYAFAILAYFGYEISLIDVGHDYYMLPFQILFFIGVAYGIKNMMKWGRSMQLLLLAILLAMPVHAFLRTNRFWSIEHTYFDRHLVLNKKEIQKLVPPDGRCIYINDVSNCIFSYVVDREGYTFNHDYLPDPWISDMVQNKNVRFMWSNSKPINDSISQNPHFDGILYQHEGTILIKLKP